MHRETNRTPLVPPPSMMGAAALLLLATGVVFFSVIEGWTLFEALRFSVTALTAIGAGELVPAHAASRVFAIVYMLSGVALLAVALRAAFPRPPARKTGEPRAGRETSLLPGFESVLESMREQGSAASREHFRAACKHLPDARLRAQLADAASMHGERCAVRWLQSVLGVHADGVLGRATLEALRGRNVHGVALRFAALRIRSIGRMIADNAANGVEPGFSREWLEHASRFIDLEAERAIQPPCLRK